MRNKIMVKRRQPKLLDLVAVTHSPDGEAVEVGDVGTVIELLPPDAVEVEFLNRDGRTRCVATLSYTDILVLNRERTKVA
jgi:catabolite regulation protein CreA